MSIFTHNVYENIRTRTIVLHEGRILLIPGEYDFAYFTGTVWSPPGGGLKPHESLAECARREVLEETGIAVRVGRIAFVREWVVPRYSSSHENREGYRFGLEVYHYAFPEHDHVEPRPETPGGPVAEWIPLEKVSSLPLWPKELKVLCERLRAGRAPDGAVSIVAQLESPYAVPESDPFE